MVVTLYSKDQCVQCDATKRKFRELGIAYVEKNAIEHLELLKGELGYMGAPVVVLDNGQHWSGYRPDLIKEIISE